ncbi:hypothetical protein [Acidithiobacillus caldus]|jgi:hypothetical protein|uniref:hypothetical protein n=1 Tax=Acidithiobacillus caldus TaxID=33059 RepID=UPI001D018CF2|nr:hypothetical protein [Acidithiobacillus caldus]
MHTKIRVESQLIEEVREVAVANGVRSATALVNWLIAAGLDDLRSGRLRVQRGMMLERVEPPSQSEPRNAGRRQRSRAASKRTVSPQGFPATNPVHSDPHQSETTEARRSRGHQSTQLRSAPVGSQPTSNPAHSDPQQSEANPHPASGPSIRSSREPTLPRGPEAAPQASQRTTAPPQKHTPTNLPDDLTEEERRYLLHPGIVLNPETGKPMVRLDPPIGIDEFMWILRRENVIGGDQVTNDTIEQLDLLELRWETPAQ